MKSCPCKGIRTCLICKPDKKQLTDKNCLTLYLCPRISKVVGEKCNSDIVCKESHNIFGEFHGIKLIEDFLNENDKLNLLNNINSCEWVGSQSGRRKQVIY